ncbi:hypothetical protein F0562_018092 [Nyssa sinensis]|uniref:Uncharacterized protein n=1 Tax=Nyssa sinensis TaxID=561372 RepID=A0A5J4Z8A8_9ASTE|nr:hypothetical protein F0562_018092 [Nyssa sinensis]
MAEITGVAAGFEGWQKGVDGQELQNVVATGWIELQVYGDSGVRDGGNYYIADSAELRASEREREREVSARVLQKLVGVGKLVGVTLQV